MWFEQDSLKISIERYGLLAEAQGLAAIIAVTLLVILVLWDFRRRP